MGHVHCFGKKLYATFPSISNLAQDPLCIVNVHRAKNTKNGLPAIQKGARQLPDEAPAFGITS